MSIKDANGKEHSLDHMVPAVQSYVLKLRSGIVSVPFVIYYTDHCYTRTREPDDPEHAVVSRFVHADGTREERVFCPERYQYSLARIFHDG